LKKKERKFRQHWNWKNLVHSSNGYNRAAPIAWRRSGSKAKCGKQLSGHGQPRPKIARLRQQYKPGLATSSVTEPQQAQRYQRPPRLARSPPATRSRETPMARARVAFALAALLFVAMAVAPLAQAAKSADAPAADAPAADAPAAEGPSGPAAAPGPVGIDGLSDDSDDDSN
jgi:hypothetical protein